MDSLFSNCKLHDAAICGHGDVLMQFANLQHFFAEEYWIKRLEICMLLEDLIEELHLNELEKPRFLLSKCINIEMQLSFDTEDMFNLPCYGNVCHRHRKLLIPWEVLLCGKKALLQEQRMIWEWKTFIYIKTNCKMTSLTRDFGECPWNHLPAAITGNEQVKQLKATGKRFSPDNSVVIDVELFTQPLDRDGKMASQLKDNTTGCNIKKQPRRPVFQFEDTFKRKETVQRVSSLVALTIIFLGLFWDVWSQSSSLMKVQPLPQEHVPVSIWPSLLRLLGFMVFIWAVAMMILVGAPFTRLHRAMLIFWCIMMHVRSANSISAVFVPILGIMKGNEPRS